MELAIGFSIWIIIGTILTLLEFETYVKSSKEYIQDNWLLFSTMSNNDLKILVYYVVPFINVLFWPILSVLVLLESMFNE